MEGGGGCLKKGELGQFADLRGSLARKRGGRGVDTHKMVKHTETIRRLLPTNFLSV